ncbi:Apple domain-containing protein [Madurella fahalii]|uniref:Apple domain-containing protein n=1 Tax=Madurella fahalii TaxID=1157608 RepID=A0ABQ0GF24_9PEZI
MDAPEVVSGPVKSLSHIFRRQGRIQTPPPVHPHPPRDRPGSMYEFYIHKTKEEVERPPEQTIWGLRRPTFVLVVSLAVVILIATIGGGVGGSMAAANARREAASDATVSMATTTIMMIPTSGGSGLGPTPTSEAGGITAAVAITVPRRGVISFDCGRISMNRQVVTFGTSSWGFDVSCMMDYIGPGVDITAMTTYSFDDCIGACAMFNKFSRNNTCVGVHFNANLTTVLPMHHGNCFLKSYLPRMSAVQDLAAVASLAYSPQF